jgi:hypothetical protein
MKTNANLQMGRGEMLDRLIAAGWPKKIGVNDKSKTNHNRVFLDGATVHTFWSKGLCSYVYDAALRLVTTGATRDDGLIAMVKARESAQSRDFGPTGAGRNAENAPSFGQQGLFAAD